MPGYNPGQVVYTPRVPVSPSSIIDTSLTARKITAVYGRGLTYRLYNWAVSAAHCRLKAWKWRRAPTLQLQSCERAMLSMNDCTFTLQHVFDSQNSFPVTMTRNTEEPFAYEISSTQNSLVSQHLLQLLLLLLLRYTLHF